MNLIPKRYTCKLPVLFAPLIFACCMLCAPPSIQAEQTSPRKMTVVASIFPLADFAQQVGGDRIHVVLLLPPGASPHTFEPTPKTVQQVSQADVFIKIGSGLEFWAERLLAGSRKKNLHIVNCSDGIGLIKGSGHADDAEKAGHSHDHSYDPHIWLDPQLSISIVQRIADVFSKNDPHNALYYRERSANYIKKLRELDAEIAHRVRLFRTREYITFHAAWNYFSRRYGLTVAGVIEEGPGREPSPRQVREIIRKLKGFSTRVVFAEVQFNPKVARAIASEAGAQVLFLDPVGGGDRTATYIQMMRYNIAAMEKALL